MSDSETKPLTLEAAIPLLPLRDVVVFPGMVIPLFVGRERSIKALEMAMEGEKKIILASQKDANVEDPKQDDIFSVGVVASIMQLLKLPDGTVKVLVEGQQRVRIASFVEIEPSFTVTVETEIEPKVADTEMAVMVKTLLKEFESYSKMSGKIAPEVMTTLNAIDDASRLADSVAAHLEFEIENKQEVLELINPAERINRLLDFLEDEIDMLRVEKRIRGRVKKQMEKSQREYYLNEQMKAIQKELGEGEDGASEFDEISEKIESSGMSKEAREKADAELKKLKMMSPMSSEATVVRGYIDALVSVPWKKRNKIRKDLQEAQHILDEDHFGLDKIKDRILEYLAVQQRKKKLKGPILCLVGPPGVGKTSLGRSIARATNRKFVRMSLGGVRDEAEIRGHRRTYIGSMPGKIVQNITKVKTKNPLFLLDEIDKMSNDFRGDPSSALLEVLDPEQNGSFVDHYLEVEYDLSDIMFVATANSLNIPGPLLDRMEIIRIEGYTEDEKLAISKNYLINKQIDNNGLKTSEINIEDSAIHSIIRYYTREAGVRGLEREIAKICRKVTKQLLVDKVDTPIVINEDNLDEYLGVKRFTFGLADSENRIGQVTGLAWTEVGGELLTIESASLPGKGKQLSTGKLGDVMQESIHAAMTVVRSRAESLGIDKEYFHAHDFHIHVPEGATPKDGPSAGVGMCTAILSAITDIPVNANVAMTGEITLRGEVLPIGGLKEKLLAAHRGGINTVVIPHGNKKDLAEIEDKIKKDLIIMPVKWIDEVLDIALERPLSSLIIDKKGDDSANADASDLEKNPAAHH